MGQKVFLKCKELWIVVINKIDHAYGHTVVCQGKTGINRLTIH
jgi:hypothetical protein